MACVNKFHVHIQEEKSVILFFGLFFVVMLKLSSDVSCIPMVCWSVVFIAVGKMVSKSTYSDFFVFIIIFSSTPRLRC